jgi:hypothetical protein
MSTNWVEVRSFPQILLYSHYYFSFKPPIWKTAKGHFFPRGYLEPSRGPMLLMWQSIWRTKASQYKICSARCFLPQFQVLAGPSHFHSMTLYHVLTTLTLTFSCHEPTSAGMLSIMMLCENQRKRVPYQTAVLPASTPFRTMTKLSRFYIVLHSFWWENYLSEQMLVLEQK